MGHFHLPGADSTRCLEMGFLCLQAPQSLLPRLPPTCSGPLTLQADRKRHHAQTKRLPSNTVQERDRKGAYQKLKENPHVVGLWAAPSRPPTGAWHKQRLALLPCPCTQAPLLMSGWNVGLGRCLSNHLKGFNSCCPITYR